MAKGKLKSTLRALIGSIAGWKWFTVVLLIFLSALLLVGSEVAIYLHEQAIPKSDSPWFSVILPIASKIGIAILSGGVFTFLLKTAEYNDLFKEQLRSVLVSDDVLLANRNRIHETLFSDETLAVIANPQKQKFWKGLTRAHYTEFDQSLGKAVAEKIFERYLVPPNYKNYYIDDFKVTYHIKKHDKKHVRLIEEQVYDMVTFDPECLIHKEYFVFKLPGAADKGDLKIKEFKINEKDKPEFISDMESGKKELNGVEYLTKGKKIYGKLSGKGRYGIRLITEVIHSIEILPYWRYVFGKYTNGFSIDIEYDVREYLINLELIYKGIKFEDIFLTSPGRKQQSKDLLLPTDGYIIIIKPNNLNHEKQ